jgi:ABC-2 type transport system ATP-binding protein
MALIHAENLSKIFNNIPVLNQLNFAFNPGERISLSGPNGAGKTTLMRCILGQYVFDGKLMVLDKEPRKHHQEIMTNVGFVPQVPPPLKMTIRELFHFFTKLTGVAQDEFTAIAEKLGLQITPNLNKPFFKLSGGMKQKLLVAFALGRKPQILLMDEPAANLDPAAREIFFEYLHQYNHEALMILCSHRMSEISKLVSRSIEMDLGKIVLDEQVK